MLELSYFERQLGNELSIATESGAVPATVVEVTAFSKAEGTERQSYSVLLEGPLEPLFEQRMYEFEFADGQRHSLFMVPIGPKGETMCYELVFT